RPGCPNSRPRTRCWVVLNSASARLVRFAACRGWCRLAVLLVVPILGSIMPNLGRSEPASEHGSALAHCQHPFSLACAAAGLLAEIDLAVMPSQEIGRWAVLCRCGQHPQRLPVVGVILASVLELILDSTTDLHPQVLRDGQITAVKQRVQVFTEKHSVADQVRAGLRARPD